MFAVNYFILFYISKYFPIVFVYLKIHGVIVLKKTSEKRAAGAAGMRAPGRGSRRWQDTGAGPGETLENFAVRNTVLYNVSKVRRRRRRITSKEKNMSNTELILTIALFFGLGLGAALIVFSVFCRKKLPSGLCILFGAVGGLAVLSSGLMLAGMLLR